MLKVKSLLIVFLFSMFSLGLMSSKSVSISPVEGKPVAAGVATKDFDLKRMMETAKGGKLSFKEKLVLKVFGKKIKKAMNQPQTAKSTKGISKVGYIVLAIFGLGFIGVGLASAWEGNDWWITLLLSLLFWLPGLIYALIVMKKYYK